MGLDLQSASLKERIAGKWQLPLMAISLLLFFTTAISLRPEAPFPSVQDWVAELDSLRRGLLLPEAAAVALDVLEDDHYEPQELGPIYAALADIRFRIASAKEDWTDRELVNLLANYAQAELLGHVLDGDDLDQQGRVYEWLGQSANALRQYKSSLDRAPSDPLAVRRRALALQIHTVPAPRAQLHADLDELLELSEDRPEILRWALDHKVQLLMDEDRLGQAETLVSHYRSDFATTVCEPFVEYLMALLQYKRGGYDEAELTLRNLRNKLEVRDEIHARSGWLLGQVILRDDGPQRPLEAITFFHDVLNSHSTGEYATASRLGLAEALTDLERFDEALAQYERVLEDLKSLPHTRLINRGVIRNSLTIHSRILQDSDRPDDALSYLQAAAELVDLDDGAARAFYLAELASMKRALGASKRDRAGKEQQAGNLEIAKALGARSAAFFTSAADDYLELSVLKIAEESQAAAALWDAATMFDAAGRRHRTIELLEEFLVSRPASARVPQVLFKLAQAYQAEGDLPRAIEHYQMCIRDYPRTTSAYDSFIPLADCFVVSGPEYVEQAERTLLQVLEEPADQPSRFTPQSSIYREAIFKIGELYSREGRNEDAIQWFDEAVQRYPGDARLSRAIFLLANAYRHSGLGLDNVASDISNAPRREGLQKEKRNRLHRAEEFFGQVITKLSEKPPKQLSAVQHSQLRLSYTYRADCAFDVGDHERAVALYEEAVRAYQDHPVALTAYLQIINCYESLGRVDEIRPALQRAHWLTDKIAPEEFETQLIWNRPGDWHKHLAWIENTGQPN